MQKSTRLKKEIKQLAESPASGISCWAVQDKIDQLEACIIAQDDTPYAGGIFKLSLQIPDRYPFEPPQVRFITPVYHPNIDNAGRICLDILKMPPKGAWRPSHNISTLLKSIQLLLSDPNPDDPLMADIGAQQLGAVGMKFNLFFKNDLYFTSTEFKCNRPLFNEKAKQWTRDYAMELERLQRTSDKAPRGTERQENIADANNRKRSSESTGAATGVKKLKDE